MLENIALQSLNTAQQITCINNFQILKVAKMVLSVCFMPKPVLYRHSPIVWWLKIGAAQTCQMNVNTMAETTRNTLNQFKQLLREQYGKNSTRGMVSM